jgi:hypothetical protein
MALRLLSSQGDVLEPESSVHTFSFLSVAFPAQRGNELNDVGAAGRAVTLKVRPPKFEGEHVPDDPV